RYGRTGRAFQAKVRHEVAFELPPPRARLCARVRGGLVLAGRLAALRRELSCLGCGCSWMLLEKIKGIEERFADLERKLSDPATIANNREYAALAKERS